VALDAKAKPDLKARKETLLGHIAGGGGIVAALNQGQVRAESHP
jgi:hypothetical protein